MHKNWSFWQCFSSLLECRIENCTKMQTIATNKQFKVRKQSINKHFETSCFKELEIIVFCSTIKCIYKFQMLQSQAVFKLQHWKWQWKPTFRKVNDLQLFLFLCNVWKYQGLVQLIVHTVTTLYFVLKMISLSCGNSKVMQSNREGCLSHTLSYHESRITDALTNRMYEHMPVIVHKYAIMRFLFTIESKSVVCQTKLRGKISIHPKWRWHISHILCL